MNCKICDGNLHSLLNECRDYTHRVDFDRCFNVYVCEKCGCGFTQPVLSFEQLSKYYPDQYEPYDNKKGIINKFMNSAKKKDLKHISKMLKIQNPSLFEIGAGNGDFLSLAQEYDFSIEGLEMNAHGIKNAKMQHGVDIIQCNAESHIFHRKYSVIVARHVLEHLDKFDELIEKISASALEDSGILLLKLPRFDSLEIKLFGRYSWGLDTPRHLNHFTKKGINILLRNKGFSDIKVTCEQNPLDYLRGYKRLIKEQKRSVKIFLYISAPFFLIAYLFMLIKPNRMTILARKG